MCNLNEEDIENLDKIEYELSQKQESAEETTAHDMPLEAVDRKPCQKRYGSPKSHEKAFEAMSNDVPQKTQNQTKWAGSVWKGQVVSRNWRLLHGETPFSSDIKKIKRQRNQLLVVLIHIGNLSKGWEKLSTELFVSDMLWAPAPFV